MSEAGKVHRHDKKLVNANRSSIAQSAREHLDLLSQRENQTYELVDGLADDFLRPR
jgi:hypothetical protein